MRFCTHCGAALEDDATPRAAPATERRVVSVLFADLVGFTPASAERDPEDTRELLSSYFELARTVVERYGGTVEKFIGDAVMAVWGTPIAQEDDAERAVRAALDLVGAVPELGPALDARGGVLTGEAAVDLEAAGQGMVAGDLVNTASRIQSLAPPGAVLVGETTRRASEAAIAYEDQGLHEVRGKPAPIQLYRALRVIAARGGALRSGGLEPPFVGRTRELRVVKELFHACADDRTAHLVSVVGAAGNGKSRLAWEFEKYIDGVIELVRWHRGRCLPYGEGVTYWALAEMVRMRAGISEGEDAVAARSKLRESVETHVPDAEERAWIEPRLAQLLGLEERQVHEREDLFAGWRRFFERMAEGQPVILVFDDMHWADPSLLDFVEYLLEWSRQYPIFVLALARPELVERNPDWGAGRRNFTSLALEPLAPDAMDALLAGLVPGLPEEVTAQILGRSEGVPLYAVETVRMLLDRGLVRRQDDGYILAGAVEALDVPETLHALIAARLDGLEPDERRLIQDAAVIGRTFSKDALAAVSDLPEPALEEALPALVRKELLSLQIDPRSPERGQYGFVQDLLKHVAYETLARRERKRRHLAFAAHLERAAGSGDPEVVEVVAAHYLDAYEVAPDDSDAHEIKVKARETLTRAGERAASLAASEEASRYFSHAAELADEPLVEADLRERAGDTATAAGSEEGRALYRRAIELLEAEGQTHPAARVLARLGWADWRQGQLDQAIERMEAAFAILSDDEPDADFATLAAELGRLNFFADKVDRAAELLELAVSLGEDLVLPEVLAEALITHGLISAWSGRVETQFALTSHALRLALEHDRPTPALRAYNNLADNLSCRDRYGEALAHLENGLALARRVGNRQWEWQLLAEMTYPLAFIGRWDDALSRISEIPQSFVAGALALPPLMPVDVWVARGSTSEARHFLELLPSPDDTEDVQLRAMLLAMHATLLRAEGRSAEALAMAQGALEGHQSLGWMHQALKNAFVEAAEAAFVLREVEEVKRLVALLETIRPGQVSPYVRAQSLRVRARLAALEGTADVERGFKQAQAIFREFGVPFWLAVTQLEHAEWLAAEGRAAEAQPLLEEARSAFERLEAAPWLDRVASSLEREPVAAS